MLLFQEYHTCLIISNPLKKQGHLVHNWKARWFVLMSDKLLYYKYEGGKRDSCQRGKILLEDCEITCPFLEYENRPVSCSRQLVVSCHRWTFQIFQKKICTWRVFAENLVPCLSCCLSDWMLYFPLFMFLLVETTVKVRLPRLRPSSHTSLHDKNLLPQVFLFCQDLISIIRMWSVLTDHSVINKPEHQSSFFSFMCFFS